MVLLIWLIVVICEAARHTFLIRVKKISPNKFWSLAGRVLIAAGLGWWDLKTGPRNREWWELLVFYLSTGLWFHNTIIAKWAMKEKPWYLNDTGVIDRRLKPYAAYFWIVLTILCFGSIGMYYLNY